MDLHVAKGILDLRVGDKIKLSSYWYALTGIKSNRDQYHLVIYADEFKCLIAMNSSAGALASDMIIDDKIITKALQDYALANHDFTYIFIHSYKNYIASIKQYRSLL